MRFEDLCLSMIYRMRRWEKIEHYGRTGDDSAVDISAVELLENGKRDLWHFQCKRYDKMTKAQIRKIIKDYCEKNDIRPDYYYLITGCDVSKSVRDCLDEEGKKNSFKTVGVIAASELEAILYAEHHDLLFAFFGVNMSEERNEKINSIRRNIALKKRMHKDFYKPMTSKSSEEHMKRIREPWRCFISSEVLIRSIYDKSYPDNTLLTEDGTGYYKAEIFNWYHNGLMVHAYPYAVDASVKYLKDGIYEDSDNPDDYEIVKERLDVIGCIPFENIIEYYIDGDEFYNYPHLFCDFVNGSDPYEEIRYYRPDGHCIDNKDIVKIE